MIDKTKSKKSNINSYILTYDIYLEMYSPLFWEFKKHIRKVIK